MTHTLVIDDAKRGPIEITLSSKGVLFCDVDGTLADITHRRDYVEKKPKNWKRFKAEIHLDTPIAHVIAAVQQMKNSGWTIVLMSGRDEASRKTTVDWMTQFDVPFDALYMRPDGDYRRDDVVKEELLDAARADGFDPTIVFDDREQVVQMWRRLDIECVQVALGDF